MKKRLSLLPLLLARAASAIAPGVWLIIILVGAHVVMVPIFLWIVDAHNITIPPGAQVTLPARATSPPGPTIIGMAAPVAAASPVHAPPAEAQPLSIQADGHGRVVLSVPGMCSLWESNGSNWYFLRNCYAAETIEVDASEPLRFWATQPIQDLMQ